MLEVDESKCTGCGSCVETCPFGALALVAACCGSIVEVDKDVCAECGACVGDCPNDALDLT